VIDDPDHEFETAMSRHTKKPKSATPATGKSVSTFTAEERAAMKEHVRELRAEARAGGNRADAEREVLAKISEMPEPDRTTAERLHAIVAANAPSLSPKTWYGTLPV